MPQHLFPTTSESNDLRGGGYYCLVHLSIFLSVFLYISTSAGKVWPCNVFFQGTVFILIFCMYLSWAKHIQMASMMPRKWHWGWQCKPRWPTLGALCFTNIPCIFLFYYLLKCLCHSMGRVTWRSYFSVTHLSFYPSVCLFVHPSVTLWVLESRHHKQLLNHTQNTFWNSKECHVHGNKMVLCTSFYVFITFILYMICAVGLALR